MRHLKTLREFDHEHQTFFQNSIDISLIIIAFLLAMGIIWLVIWSMG